MGGVIVGQEVQGGSFERDHEGSGEHQKFQITFLAFEVKLKIFKKLFRLSRQNSGILRKFSIFEVFFYVFPGKLTYSSINFSNTKGKNS